MTETAIGEARAQAAASVQSGADEAERRSWRTRWLLVAPALLIIGGIGIAPLSIILLYSIMVPAEYAGVIWELSPEAWINLILERDMFEETLGLSDAHLRIYTRSILAALFTTFMALVFGFPTAYFIATRPVHTRNIWLFLITIPFWTNLLIRTFAIMLLVRDQGVINNVLIWAGVIDRPIEMLFTNFAVALGLLYVYLPFMVLPTLCVHGKTGLQAGRGGLRPLCGSLAGAAPGDHTPGQARHHRRRHPGVHPLDRRLCDTAAAGRWQEHDAWKSDRQSVRHVAQLAARVGHGAGIDGHGDDCACHLCAQRGKGAVT